MRKVTSLLLVAVCVLVLAACGQWGTLNNANRWGCGSHNYYINPAGAPAGAVQTVQAAFNQANAAAGNKVHFQYAGTTTLTTGQTGSIIVWWLRMSDYGLGAPQPWPSGDNGRWTGGVIELNNAYPTTQLGVALHEVGHVAGLAHVDDYEVMNPNQTVHGSMTQYQDGDLAGLATLASECRP